MIKVFFNNNFYTKYNIINFRYLNLCVIKWEPKMVTELHDHPNTKCNFFLIDGLLQENVYDKEKKYKKKSEQKEKEVSSIYNTKILEKI